MTFDASRQRVLLFGGQLEGAANLADTWSWDGADWTQVADTGPGARALHGLTYDAVREQVVVFGGGDSSGNVLDDTWAWDGAAWTEVAHFGPPAATAV